MKGMSGRLIGPETTIFGAKIASFVLIACFGFVLMRSESGDFVIGFPRFGYLDLRY